MASSDKSAQSGYPSHLWIFLIQLLRSLHCHSHIMSREGDRNSRLVLPSVYIRFCLLYFRDNFITQIQFHEIFREIDFTKFFIKMISRNFPQPLPWFLSRRHVFAQKVVSPAAPGSPSTFATRDDSHFS